MASVVVTKFLRRVNPQYLSLVLFTCGIVWTILLGHACISCLEAKPRGTFLSEPTLLPGSASTQMTTMEQHQFSVDFPQISPQVHGKLCSSKFASDRREVLCLAMLDTTQAREHFAYLAYMVEHEFKWLAKDVLLLLLPQLQSDAALDELLMQYTNNYTLAMPRSGSITSALVLHITNTTASSLIHVHGRNGKLPNMDLINTAAINTGARLANHDYKSFLHGMLLGADGLHAVFLDHGIQALSLTLQDSRVLGARIESMVRSLSNLGERFNRSFMFYFMLNTDSFVSVDEYLWSLVLVLAPLAVNAFAYKSLLQAYLFSMLLGLGICHYPLALLAATFVLPVCCCVNNKRGLLFLLLPVFLAVLFQVCDVFGQEILQLVLVLIILPTITTTI